MWDAGIHTSYFQRISTVARMAAEGESFSCCSEEPRLRRANPYAVLALLIYSLPICFALARLTIDMASTDLFKYDESGFIPNRRGSNSMKPGNGPSEATTKLWKKWTMATCNQSVDIGCRGAGDEEREEASNVPIVSVPLS